MMSPEELNNGLNKGKFVEDLGKALQIVNHEAKKGLNKGGIKIMIPTNMELGNLYYHDEKQEALAKELLNRGYNCKKESEIIDGVRQHPRWFLYFSRN